MSTQYVHEDPATWPQFHPLIIAHDVGRSRDRSTAVIGGNSYVQPRRLGILELEELPLASTAMHVPARWRPSTAAITTMR